MGGFSPYGCIFYDLNIEMENIGLDGWRVVELDKHTYSDNYDLWFENKAIPKTVNGDYEVYVSKKDYLAYVPVEKSEGDIALLKELNRLSDKGMKDILATISKDHRTLQQRFTKLCLEWLELCASNDYSIDLRNEDSKNIAKEILEGFIARKGSSFKPSEYLRNI